MVADAGDIYTLLDPYLDYGLGDDKPDAKWDYCGIGGHYDGALPLSQPRKLRRFFGLLSVGETMNVSVAKKSEIDIHTFLQDPPAALFFRGKLFECQPSATGEALDNWKKQFGDIFSDIPEDTLLQIVDAHG